MQKFDLRKRACETLIFAIKFLDNYMGANEHFNGKYRGSAGKLVVEGPLSVMLFILRKSLVKGLRKILVTTTYWKPLLFSP